VNYSAKIARDVQVAIGSWGLPRELLIAVLNHLLVDLPANPDNLLGPPMPPTNTRPYQFIIRAPLRHLFWFAVDRDDASQELRVIACRHAAEEGSEN
jgi:hypothetical protein